MSDNKKVILLGALFLIGLSVVCYLYFFDFSKKVEMTNTGPKEPTIEYVVGKLPAGLPENLPLEDGVVLARNENITTPDSKEVQGVRIYYSKKTVSQNFEIYKKYLKENGWLVMVEQNSKDFALLLAEKEGDKGNFKISISKNSITGDVSVEINMVVKN